MLMIGRDEIMIMRNWSLVTLRIHFPQLLLLQIKNIVPKRKKQLIQFYPLAFVGQFAKDDGLKCTNGSNHGNEDLKLTAFYITFDEIESGNGMKQRIA